MNHISEDEIEKYGKKSSKCKFVDGEWWYYYLETYAIRTGKIRERVSSIIKKNKKVKKRNLKRMFVNSKYVPQSHPLYKPGSYKTFEDAAFSSLEKYESSTEGQVYVITNPNFPEWVKVGMAVDAEDRLSNYQTSSPFRDYSLAASWDVADRRSAESEAHAALQKLYERQSEWFNCTPEQAKGVVEEIIESYK
tara:strand:- start:6413 stop:6991 length:579 start_codon:yes stop_codon:yes gene_type:complete